MSTKGRAGFGAEPDTIKKAPENSGTTFLIYVWQEREDSNPRPLVLETSALTRLSYAPALITIITVSTGDGYTGERPYSVGAAPSTVYFLSAVRSDTGRTSTATRERPTTSPSESKL